MLLNSHLSIFNGNDNEKALIKLIVKPTREVKWVLLFVSDD